MSSLFIMIMLHYLSLATCFCEGRRLHTSLSHSRKDVIKLKYPSSPTLEANLGKVHQTTAMTGKSRSYKNHKMEDNIRESIRPSSYQRSITVAVLQHKSPCRVSEENPGTMALVRCCLDDLSQTKQNKVKFQKQVRSLLVGTKWNEEQVNPSKNIDNSSLVEMDYPSAHLAPSVNNRHFANCYELGSVSRVKNSGLVSVSIRKL